MDNETMPSEVLFKTANGYLYIQDSSEGGWDYTFYDPDFKDLDGGCLDYTGESIYAVAEELLRDNQNMDIAEAEELEDIDDFFEQVA